MNMKAISKLSDSLVTPAKPETIIDAFSKGMKP